MTAPRPPRALIRDILAGQLAWEEEPLAVRAVVQGVVAMVLAEVGP